MTQAQSGAGGYKTPASEDTWQDAQEVEPKYPENEPKRCAACGKIFLPTWHTARRCEFCRRMKIPYLDEPNQEKPF